MVHRDPRTFQHVPPVAALATVASPALPVPESWGCSSPRPSSRESPEPLGPRLFPTEVGRDMRGKGAERRGGVHRGRPRERDSLLLTWDPGAFSLAPGWTPAAGTAQAAGLCPWPGQLWGRGASRKRRGGWLRGKRRGRGQREESSNPYDTVPLSFTAAATQEKAPSFSSSQN